MKMTGMGGGKDILLSFFIATVVFTALPSISAAASNAPNKKPKVSSAPPPSSPAPPMDTRPRLPSSIVFPLYGNVYPNGLFYVQMSVGDPAKPYYLDVDTGSDLTWLQCDAPCVRCFKGPHPWYRPRKDKLVPCRDPLCAALHSGTVHDLKCSQCDYEILYHDYGSSLGVLVADSFALTLSNNSIARPVLAFGCGYDQEIGNEKNKPELTDGVLGLGSGKVSILSQLSNQGITRNVVGHCLGGKGSGYLFFGDGLVPKSGMTWAPLSRTGSKNYYAPGPAKLFWGSQSLGVKQMEVVFDSGSSYTYFASEPYQALLSAVKKDLSKTPLKKFADQSLPECWKGQRPFRSVEDVKKYFTALTLTFGNGNIPLEVPPENYLIITKFGNVCLGILDGTQSGLKNLNVIGDISLQDHLVVYDNENQQIGWMRISCNRLPNADANDGGHEGFRLPQFPSMGMLPGERPHYHSKV